MEPSHSGVMLARAAVPEAVFYEKGVYDAPASVPENDFDAVISTEVVEHLFRPSALPEFAAAKLKPAGLLVVSTPYHGYLKNLLLSLLNQWDAHHTSLWDGGHIKFWSRRSLTRLLVTHGFQVLEFHGAGRVRWLWKSMVIVARKLDPVPTDAQCISRQEANTCPTKPCPSQR
jgi:SAM-dependent methyltransferase